MKSQRLAIVIGINSYPYPEEQLQGCVGDAQRFGRFLLSGRGGSFSKIIPLMDSEATCSNILQVLWSAARETWHQVIIYFAGHGAPEGVLAWDKLLAFSRLAPAIMSIPASWHLLVLDTCHAGAIHEYFGLDGIGGLEKHATVDAARIYLNLLSKAEPGLRVITAVDRYTLSVEKNAQGVFTTALLRAARHALPDLSPWGVSAARVFKVAKRFLAGGQYPLPQSSGNLGDFPLAVTDLLQPLGVVEPRHVRFVWEQIHDGSLQVSFEFNVDIQGRKLMPLLIQHELYDVKGGLISRLQCRGIPSGNNESKSFFARVPAYRLPRGRPIRSTVIVRDEHKRVVGRDVETYFMPRQLRFGALPVTVL